MNKRGNSLHRLVGSCAVLLVLGACGRIGFDDTQSADTDGGQAVVDAPDSTMCVANEECPETCIAGQCAGLSPVGGACDDSDDCVGGALQCVAAQCLAAVGCTGTQTFGADGDPAEPGVYDSIDHPILQVDSERAGCVFEFTVDGAGGGRGNHDNPPSNADGGSGGRIAFEFVPGATGAFTLVIGGGGTGDIANGTLDDPGPGAGGGGSSQVNFAATGAILDVLAIAGGGGGGGWAEIGTHGGGGDNGCGDPCDEGSTGGCAGVTGTPHQGGEPGGNCQIDEDTEVRIPCGGPGGSGTVGAGGYGVGDGFGGNEEGSSGSGGGGGGYGGGSAGGGAGDPGLGGGGYFNSERAILLGGATGGADNAARYDDDLALAGGDGRVVVTVRPPQ